MFRDKKRYGQDPGIVVRSAPPTFNKPLTWEKPAMVFTCSWSDFFVKEADAWRDESWDIIRQTPHLTYQILTKRPERILDNLPEDWDFTGYRNVWLGVSIENQEMADKRIPLLLDVPIRVRFLSCEPLLGELDLEWYLDPGINRTTPVVQWVITGGESGVGRNWRPANPAWFRSIRDQCLSAGVPYFHKQNGGNRKIDGAWGGRKLDGEIWNQMPDVQPALAEEKYAQAELF